MELHGPQICRWWWAGPSTMVEMIEVVEQVEMVERSKAFNHFNHFNHLNISTIAEGIAPHQRRTWMSMELNGASR